MLNKEQLEIINKNDESILIIAGAGTGKTKTITEKIAHIIKSGTFPQKIIALTFTNKAANEMRERLNLIESPFIGTFHSFCVKILREFHQDANLQKNFIILDAGETKKIIKTIIKKHQMNNISATAIQRSISIIKKSIDCDNPLKDESMLLLDDYKKELKNENAVDFDDLIIKTIELLNIKEIGEAIQKRFDYIFIDEFQDTDRLESLLVDKLYSKDTKIFAVGDTDQTIYSWRGALIGNMLNFTKKYIPSKEMFLIKNYRSTKKILDAANAVISKNKLRQKKELIPTSAEGANIELIVGKDGEDEANQIANEVSQINSEGVDFGDIAILLRTNFQARVFEKEFLIRKIPYVVTGVKFFERAEIKDILSILTLLVNNQSKIAYKRAIKLIYTGFGDKTIDKIFENGISSLAGKTKEKALFFEDFINKEKEKLKTMPLNNYLKQLIKEIDYKEYLKTNYENYKDRGLEVLELISMSNKFSTMPSEDGINLILSESALSSDQDTLSNISRKNSLKIITVHSAKGLEFDTVFIAGLEDGLFPFNFEDTDKEEERRLCYVAITRAKRKLYCSFAIRRAIYGTYKKTISSEYLKDIFQNTIANTNAIDNYINASETLDKEIDK